MSACPTKRFEESAHEHSLVKNFVHRSKSLCDFHPEMLSLDTAVNSTPFSRGTACFSNQSSPIGMVTSNPLFSTFDQPENSGNDTTEARLQFNESSKVNVGNLQQQQQPNLGLVGDDVETSKDSKQMHLEKAIKHRSLSTIPPPPTGNGNELDNKCVPMDDVSKGRFTVRNAARHPCCGIVPSEAIPDGSAVADGPVQRGRFKVRPVLSDAGGGHGDSSTSETNGQLSFNDNRLLVGVMTEHNASMAARMESLERALLLSGKISKNGMGSSGQHVGGPGRDFHPIGNSTTVDKEVGVLGALSTLVDRMKTEMENVQCRVSDMSIELRALKSKNKQLENLYEEQKKKTAMITVRLNEEREKVQSLKQQLKSDGQAQIHPCVSPSTGEVSYVKQDEIQGWSTVIESPAANKEPSMLKPCESGASLNTLQEKLFSPKEGFFTQQQHEPLGYYLQQQAPQQQHHTAQYLHHPTSSTTQQGSIVSPVLKRPSVTAYPIHKSNTSDSIGGSLSELENLSKTTSLTSVTTLMSDGPRPGFGTLQQTSGSGLSVHGGPSGLPQRLGQGGTQPKSNTKQGNTAGAAISQMTGTT